jgi:hypothetical protein
MLVPTGIRQDKPGSTKKRAIAKSGKKSLKSSAIIEIQLGHTMPVNQVKLSIRHTAITQSIMRASAPQTQYATAIVAYQL